MADPVCPDYVREIPTVLGAWRIGMARRRTAAAGLLLTLAQMCSSLRYGPHSPRRAARGKPARLCEGDTHSRLLSCSGLLSPDGTVTLRPVDVETALADMHLRCSEPELPGISHPRDFLPPCLRPDGEVDVTELVRTDLARVLDAHPIFTAMADEVLGNDDWYRSVYFGGAERDHESLGFEQLCRRLVASVFVFEALLALGPERHADLARWYEAQLRSVREGAAPAREAAGEGARDRFMGRWLELKGESVLASVNAFELLRRSGQRRAASGEGGEGAGGAGGTADAGGANGSEHATGTTAALSDVLEAIMRLNIFEAVVANLSFARWPDNARAGMALLLAPQGRFDARGEQALSAEWRDLYLAWNACFIWPAHADPSMMSFTMLAMPSIALGPPAAFQYSRAHTLLWVVRSTQLSRARATHPRGGRFRCRPLPPLSDRQPITTRTARLTRAAGERLAAEAGEDVRSAAVWWRLLVDVLPSQLGAAARVYGLMPKEGLTKLRLLL